MCHATGQFLPGGQASLLRGEIIQPEDQNYNEAQKVYNGMIGKRPAIIVRCADVADGHCLR